MAPNDPESGETTPLVAKKETTSNKIPPSPQTTPRRTNVSYNLRDRSPSIAKEAQNKDEVLLSPRPPRAGRRPARREDEDYIYY